MVISGLNAFKPLVTSRFKPMKITKVNASFEMKKSLGNYEMATIFFAAEAELAAKDNPEEVAEKVHDFCKKLAVEKYNSFSRVDLTPKASPEEEYTSSFEQPKSFTPKPGEIEAIKRRTVTYEPKYEATDREGGKKLINREENTLNPQ